MKATVDRYSRKVRLYSECDYWLNRLHKEKSIPSILVLRTLGKEFPREEVVQELYRIGAAKDGNNGELESTELTHSLFVRNYFREKMEDLEYERHHDELVERSTKSAELSADAAFRSADSAGKSNKIAMIALFVSFASLVVSIVFNSCNSD